MGTQNKEDLEAVLRTLRLAQAQLRALKADFAKDPAKDQEVKNAEVAIDMLVKKLTTILP